MKKDLNYRIIITIIEILTLIHDDHLWNLLEWEYAWPCWSF